ncbi:MAG: hypothetical protein Q7S07_04215 [Candidatus Omnitrophota bacterium]|nr:hypothetical protein [Candidatus Omnitrophota bacterium]
MEQERESFAIPHFKDYWFVIIKRKKFVVISIIFFILMGLLHSQKGEPVYEARAKIMIATGGAAYTTGEGSGVFYKEEMNTERYDNEYEIMRSSAVAKRTAAMLGMEGEDAIEDIRGAVEISPVQTGYQSTNIAFIVARSSDPKKAMDIANYTAKAYIATIEADLREKVKKTYDIYSEQLQELKGKLRDSEIALDEYRRKHGIENIEDKMDRSEKELVNLLAVYTEKHPLVIEKRAQIADLTKGLKENLKDDAGISDTDPKNSAPGKAKSEYYTLEQEVQGNRALYNNLTGNMKELNISEEMSKIAGAKVMEWATLPAAAEKTRNMMLFFSPFLGLIIGISIVFFLEYMDNTIKTEADVKQYLGSPVIGIIQHIKEED